MTLPDTVPVLDPADPAVLLDPFTAYGRAREESPVARMPLPGMGTLWIVTRYDDARAVLNDPRFGSRMRGEGLFADHIAQMFSISCRRAGIAEGRFPKLSSAAFRKSSGMQPPLFD